MGQRCGYRQVPVVLLSAPAVRKHRGWEGSTKGRLYFGEGDREVPSLVGTATLSHACRDSSLECCPSNPDLISFILRTIKPSSLPVVPYHTAEARTEPLKLTITLSECLFGVIQAQGKVREGRRRALFFFFYEI